MKKLKIFLIFFIIMLIIKLLKHQLILNMEIIVHLKNGQAENVGLISLYLVISSTILQAHRSTHFLSVAAGSHLCISLLSQSYPHSQAGMQAE